jgi:uncharacterized membrane protein
MTPLAVVSTAAHLGRLRLQDTPLAFLNHMASALVFCLLALGELGADKWPGIPGRKQPFPFGARIISGAIAGGAVGASAGSLVVGAVLGGIGAAIGTIGGSALRARLAEAFHKDLPAALLEDAVAVFGAVLLILLVP